MVTKSGSGVYAELGVNPVINAQGNRTVLGGSVLAATVRAAMDEANEQYVEMEELLQKSGEYLADLLGTEGAYITSGCGAALTLSATACMAGTDPDLTLQLPDTTGMKDEILIQKRQRYSYDRCYTVSGGKLVPLGDEDGCTPEQLEAAIGPKTAAVAYLIPAQPDDSVVSLEETVKIAHDHDVPVIADAAAQIYPLEFFHWNAQSADLVCFGAKYLGAPHATGFVCGKKELIDAVVSHGFIGFHTGGSRAIGRPLKVDRQGIIAVCVALKNWFTINHEDRLLGIETRLSAMRRGLLDIPNVRATVVPHELYWGSSLHAVMDTKALGKSPEDVAKELHDGSPSVRVNTEGEDTLVVNAHTLNDGEEEIVVERLRSALLG